MSDDIQFNELEITERTLLLQAFDYDVDKEGFILSPTGGRILSKETPKKCLKVEEAMLISGPGGRLEVLDGTPTAISRYLHTIEEAETDKTEKKKHYCCYYIIGGTMQHPPTKVFICGVCKRELARYPMDGVAKTMELIVEECCSDYWQKW